LLKFVIIARKSTFSGIDRSRENFADLLFGFVKIILRSFPNVEIVFVIRRFINAVRAVAIKTYVVISARNLKINLIITIPTVFDLIQFDVLFGEFGA
jgi:hypothetical protein